MAAITAHRNCERRRTGAGALRPVSSREVAAGRAGVPAVDRGRRGQPELHCAHRSLCRPWHSSPRSRRCSRNARRRGLRNGNRRVVRARVQAIALHASCRPSPCRRDGHVHAVPARRRLSSPVSPRHARRKPAARHARCRRAAARPSAGTAGQGGSAACAQYRPCAQDEQAGVRSGLAMSRLPRANV
jgi:hypothetical protein